MRIKKRLIEIIGILLIVLIVFATLLFTGTIKLFKQDIINDDISEVVDEKKAQPERQLWLANKSINADYVGEIVFSSGLINKSFVQAKSVYETNEELYKFYDEKGNLVLDGSEYNGNDVYLWTNWKTGEYDYDKEGGSIILDYNNNLDDQNLIIYGHHFSIEGGHDANRNKAFTPLDKLLDFENYENNKELKLILDNETRTYVLAYVFKFDSESDYYWDNAQYFRPNYDYDLYNNCMDDSYFDKYIECLEEVKLYDTGIKLNTDDITLTLQTCISNSDTCYEICVFKQTSIEYFD